MFNLGDFDIYEFGDMYYDFIFDLFYFNVIGDLDFLIGFVGMGFVIIFCDVVVLQLIFFGIVIGYCVFIFFLDGQFFVLFLRKILSQLLDFEFQFCDFFLLRSWIREVFGLMEDVESLCFFGCLGLNYFYFIEMKRVDIFGFFNDMRLVYFDGSFIDENLVNFLFVQMQDYMDLFFIQFNFFYFIIYLVIFEVLDVELLFLLVMMVFGVIYKGKDDYQFFVCIYDVMMLYIMSGLVGIKVFELLILQVFLIFECYGMYCVGLY